MGALISWLRRKFWEKAMDIAVIGLQNAGKSTFVHMLNTGRFEEDMIPTRGINLRRVKKGRVTIKIWDLGGQEQYRNMWVRYARSANTILFMVDSGDAKLIPQAKKELHDLIASPSVAGKPLLVLFNKTDLQSSQNAMDLARELDLSSITGRMVAVYAISCKTSHNIDTVLNWLIQHAS